MLSKHHQQINYLLQEQVLLSNNYKNKELVRWKKSQNNKFKLGLTINIYCLNSNYLVQCSNHAFKQTKVQIFKWAVRHLLEIQLVICYVRQASWKIKQIVPLSNILKKNINFLKIHLKALQVSLFVSELKLILFASNLAICLWTINLINKGLRLLRKWLKDATLWTLFRKNILSVEVSVNLMS